MRAQQIIKEKKKKSRHLGGFPVVGIYFGNSTDSSDSGSEVEEAMNWKGTASGVAQSELTDHSFEEAETYIKQNYPLHKTYNIRRTHPGFRIMQPDGVKQVIKSITQAKGVDAAIAQLGMKENPMMSGSSQVTRSIGWSWNTLENTQHGIAVLYYQDRGMGNDTITIAAKEKNNLLGTVGVFREAGVLPTEVDMKQRQAQRVASRQALLQKKGFSVGTQLNLTDHYQTYNRVEGRIVEIMPNGKLKIEITKAEEKPEMKKVAATVQPGSTVTMAANYISKKNVINEFAPTKDGDPGNILFLLAPRLDDRKKFKIQITDATPEFFQKAWNRQPEIFHKFFNNVYPIWNVRHPLFSTLPVKKHTLEEYLMLVSSAFLEDMSSKVRAGKRVDDYSQSQDLTESTANYRTAAAIADELFKEIDDLSHALASGATTGAGNPHHIESLKSSIVELYQQLSELGYDYDPTQPNYIRVKVNEAIGLSAPHRRIDRDELQSYADRIKTGTKTKKDKFAPIIHGSNIKAITDRKSTRLNSSHTDIYRMPSSA